MPKSMTSFGRHRMVTGNKDITVEMRSVNNRFYDCSLRLPKRFSYIEDKVKQYLKGLDISRGKLDVHISVEQAAEARCRIDVDLTLAGEYIAALEKLRDAYLLEDDISVMKVAARQDLFAPAKETEDAESDFTAIKTVIDLAAAEFFAGRAAEGETLARDLARKLDIISENTDKIEIISAENIKFHAERFEERLRGIISDSSTTIDENKILTECAAFSDRVSVDEETVRLRSHIISFRNILNSTEPVGRKLDFLTQEMNREINTVGSKSQNAEIAMLVVEVKCEIEKIREQVQNLE